MELQYYTCIGIIDRFQLTMTKDEIIDKVAQDYIPWGGEAREEYSEQAVYYINSIEKKINNTIYSIEREYPHTIGYFAIPDYDNLEMFMCVVAKIYNNGSTYIFSPDKEFLKYLGASDSEIRILS